MPAIELALDDLEEKIVGADKKQVVRFDRSSCDVAGVLSLPEQLARRGFDPFLDQTFREHPTTGDTSAGKSALLQQAVDLLLVNPKVLRYLAAV